MDSSSLADVLANRHHEEEKKSEDPSTDHEQLNDVSLGEFRIQTLRMKDSDAGVVLWESSEWDLTSTDEVAV